MERKRTSRELQDNFDMLRCTVNDIGNVDTNEVELKFELETDIMRLMQEAECPEGDRRSKKIFSSLDDWLKMMLKAVVRPKRKISD